jgi:hypothetical protein
MGHPWKKKPAKSNPLFEAAFAVLLERSARNNWDGLKRQREEYARMKKTNLELQAKNRLLKRKISEFYKQGEEHGKGRNK